MMRSLLLAATCWQCLAPMATAGPAGKARCSDEELQIHARHDAGMGSHVGWRLTLEATGIGTVETDSGNEYHFRLSDDECAELVTVIQSTRFFDLKESNGVPVVESRYRDFEISLGTRRHSVTLFEGAELDVDRSAVRRAVRVWVAVRSLFNAPDAIDSREKDRAFLRDPERQERQHE